MAVLKATRVLSLLCALSSVPSSQAAPLLESVLGPIGDAVGAIVSGAGLIEGTLGAVKGILGVQQT